MLILKQQIEEYNSINIVRRYDNWEPDHPGGYPVGAIVFSEHYYYKSVVKDNLAPVKDTTSWLRWSVSNRYAAVDLQANTETVCDVNSMDNDGDNIPDGSGPYDLVMEFDTDNYDAIAFGNVYGSQLKIEVFKEDDLNNPYQVITEDIATTRYCVSSWWNYYYCPLASELDSTLSNVFHRIYPVKGVIRVTITQGYQPHSSVAYMVAGNTNYVGDSLYGASVGLIDYSRKEIDSFGILDLSKRESRQTMDINVSFDTGDTMRINKVARDVLGSVVLFVGDEDEDSQIENLLILGLLEDFTTIVDNCTKTEASFNITEVI
jgi:hypothetical protein